MTFPPIAIVGRGCALPGANDPDTFWANIVAGRCSLAPVPDGYWPQPRERILGDGADRACTDVAGIVSGLGRSSLDPVFDWTLHVARAALRDAGRYGAQPRAGLIMGSLSFPSRGLNRYGEHVLLGGPAVDPRNRFCSGYPVLFAARELALGGVAFALDAACASALYAVKLGCDRLHDGSADLMLAGGVNAAEMTFPQIGFTTLGALSRTGRSRPFHRDADGLIPGEGAVCFALMRLSDALAEGLVVHGVIRGIGLSNDGRSGGFLAPARALQVAAMRQAYAVAGLDPGTVSLVECHAAGTPAGDAVEIASTAEVFGGNADVPVGSVKSNVGHLLTAAGGAGLLKVLGALAAGTRPATLGATEPHHELRGTPLRPVHHNEEWPGRRRAAVSAFGFGGCNAHLIVEACEPGTTSVAASPPPVGEPVAVVALQGRVGRSDLETALLEGRPDRRPLSTMQVDLTGLRFPPADLPDVAPHQVLLLQAARDAVQDLALPSDRTMVVVGMGCDPEVVRLHLRWKGHEVAPPLTAVRAVGALPNVIANRVSAQLDLTGPSYTVSAEEASGTVAMQIAAGAIRAGEVDVAIVGAVDLSHEPVHEAALRALGIDRLPGDAVVVLVLKRLADARRDGDTVLAVVDEAAAGEADLTVGDGPATTLDPIAWFGCPHAAAGLLAVATAVLALHHRVVPRLGGAEDHPTMRLAEVTVTPIHALSTRIRLSVGDAATHRRSAPAYSRYVELAVHRPSVSDVLAWGVAPRPSDAEQMSRAPRLPPPPAHDIQVGLDPQQAAVPPLRPGPRHPVASMLERAAEVHRGFLLRQTDVHRHYLQVHADLEAAVLGGGASPPGHRRSAGSVGPSPPAPAGVTSTTRPLFDREQLLVHARGVISELFGPRFAAQDGFRRQTRLPEPPLLLVDRVIALDGEPASLGTGTIRTQTDVQPGGWYLGPCGRMSPGLVAEAGQADLLLISWLGIDLVNRGERVYRLLGGELIFHGGAPRAGDTLDFTIGIDAHQVHNGVRLFSFHYDCTIAGRPLLTMRNGQAGFFTDDELASSRGVIWDPRNEPARADGPVDPPPRRCSRSRFGPAAVRAFAEGRPAECFGDGWQETSAHARTPRIGSGRLLLLGEVTELDPAGGPWGRGYLCAKTVIQPDDWFFDGHFHNDPCMPGTLMVDACGQAMAFYLAAMGCTIDRDGWRFEPASGNASCSAAGARSPHRRGCSPMSCSCRVSRPGPPQGSTPTYLAP